MLVGHFTMILRQDLLVQAALNYVDENDLVKLLGLQIPGK